ncbi:unnamed protein product [Linum trigynum]|uniref:Uncharacterized protein n=1 Tax=Linum trigynum TaxID=586398 RepID=A0AAV2GR63_9ROSI
MLMLSQREPIVLAYSDVEKARRVIPVITRRWCIDFMGGGSINLIVGGAMHLESCIDTLKKNVIHYEENKDPRCSTKNSVTTKQRQFASALY